MTTSTDPGQYWIICQWCHGQSPEGSRSCPNCGASLDQRDRVIIPHPPGPPPLPGPPPVPDLPMEPAPTPGFRLAWLVAAIVLVITLAIAIPLLANAHGGTSGGQSQRRPAAAPKPPPGPAPLQTIAGDAGAVAFSPSGNTLAIAEADGTVQLYDAGNGSLLPSLAAPKLPQPGNQNTYAVGVAFSSSGTMLAAGLSDGTITVWNLTTRQVAATIVVPPTAQQDAGRDLDAIAFSPDGTTIAAGSDDGPTSFWNAVTGQQTGVFNDPAQPGNPVVRGLAFGPNGTTLAVDDLQHIYLWDVAAKRVTATIDHDATMVAFSPDGTMLATDDDDPGTVDIWNASTGSLVRTLHDPGVEYLSGIPITPDITFVAFSPSSTSLAASDDNGSTYVWNLASGNRTAIFTDRQSQGADWVAFSPDGQLLATADGNGNVYLWGAH